MAAITEDTVRALAAFRSADAPVTTCYLDVDGRRLTSHRDVQHAFDSLVKRAGLNGHSHPSVTKDVERMARHVRGWKRARARGIVMFACSAQGLWEVHELPVPVRSQLVVGDAPCVQQLEDLVGRTARLGIVLTDRQRARMFVYELGDVVERAEVTDRLERRGADDRGDMKTRVGSQRQQQVRQHLKRTAAHAFDVYQRVGFEHLAIGAPTPDVLVDLEQSLHPYLRERICDRIQMPIGVGDEQLSRAVRDIEESIDRRRDADLVGQLRDAIATSAAVHGLAPTLRAIGARRVDRLFVSRGFAAEGWRCGGCGGLATVGRRCPACGDAMRHVADVVELAVQDAMAQHCRVSLVGDSADLDVVGCIGALLRF